MGALCLVAVSPAQQEYRDSAGEAAQRYSRNHVRDAQGCFHNWIPDRVESLMPQAVKYDSQPTAKDQQPAEYDNILHYAALRPRKYPRGPLIGIIAH